ncbi:MAG: gliding motility-associated C-terminal domain-containing protein, partial [Bacteroidales bacterium]
FTAKILGPRGDLGYCTDGVVDTTIRIWINPQPKIEVTVAEDTLCNNGFINTFTIFTPNTVIGTWAYDLEIDLPAGVTNTLNEDSDILDTNPEDVLTNHTDTFKMVEYTFIPKIISPSASIDYCLDGVADTIRVWINPTPKVNITIMDTIAWDRICNESNIRILLETPTVLTSGEVTFDFVSVANDSISGNTETGSGLTDGALIDDHLTNTDNVVDTVWYTFTPRALDLPCAFDGPDVVFELKVNPDPIQSLVKTADNSCYGFSDGAIDLTTATGSGPYDILWYDGPENFQPTSEEDLYDLVAGKYSVRVFDTHGCADTSSRTINQPAQISIFAVAVPKDPDPEKFYHISCTGGNDGILQFRFPDIQNPPFSYYIYNTSNDTIRSDTLNLTSLGWQYIYNLSADTYYVDVVDSMGCQNIYPVALNDPPPIEMEFVKKQYSGYDVSCRGWSDGEITDVIITGGYEVYEDYFWYTYDGSALTQPHELLQDSLSAGTYYLQVTGKFGCIAVDSITLEDPPGIELTDTVITRYSGGYEISCAGASDGKIIPHFEGGTGDYLFEWNGPNGFYSTKDSIYDVPAGQYDLRVTDLNNCYLDFTFFLDEPLPLSIDADTSSSPDGNYHISCYEGNDGWIDLTVTGGDGNYVYEWQGMEGVNQPRVENLTAGTYHVVVIDGNGCRIEADYELTEPPPLEAEIVATGITCDSPGQDNGSADLTVSGGSGEGTYTFQWTGPGGFSATTEDISNLIEGEYTVTITDANNCQIIAETSIEPPAPLIFHATVSDYLGRQISCNGEDDGYIQIEMESGTPPYVFSWSGPEGFTSADQNIDQLIAGAYHLIITDAKNCVGDTVITMEEPDPLVITFDHSRSIDGNHHLNCYGDSTGFINAIVTGGTGEYNYLWGNGHTEPDRNNLGAGIYILTVTDENGCVEENADTLIQPPELVVMVDTVKSLCPDYPDGSITLYVSGGVEPYAYEWSNNVFTPENENLRSGTYEYLVIDFNGCEVKDVVDLEPQRPYCLQIPTAFSPGSSFGINDTWEIGISDGSGHYVSGGSLYELYPDAIVEVYDRWGRLVFRSERGYPVPWDGTYRGTPLPMDSYHYVINLHNGTPAITGNVTIVK